jgi:hypothetical protein
MDSVQTTCFLCRSFRFAYLSKLLFKGFLRKNRPAVIYYLKPGKEYSFIEHNAIFSKIFSHWLIVKQLPYDLAIIDNILGGSVWKKAYIDGLGDISCLIDRQMLDGQGSLLRALDKKFLDLHKSLKLYIKYEAAFDIMDDLLMVEIAGWLMHDKNSVLCGQTVTVLVDKKSYWAKFVFDYSRKKNINFFKFSKYRFKKNKIVQFVFYLLRLFGEYFGSFFIRKECSHNNVPNAIGIPYYVHKNFTDFFTKRNYYLFWYPDSGISSERIIIYSDGIMDIPSAEREKIEEAGFRLFACNGSLRRQDIPEYKCSNYMLKTLTYYIRILLRLLPRIRSGAALEQWKILAVLFVRLPYWQDFFRSNNIKIKCRFHPQFSHRDIAAILEGATTVYYHYSNVSRGTLDVTCQNISDVCFVWGRDHQQCFINEHSDIRNIIQAGYIFDYASQAITPRADALRRELRQGGIKFIIAILSENMGGVYRENVISSYRELMEFTLHYQDVGLIIKPKRDNIREVLKSSAKAWQLFVQLEKEGRVKVLESIRYAVEAGKASDLAIGVFAESTAAMECALAGVPSIVFECFNSTKDAQRQLSDKNRIIFYDFKSMFDAIRQYKEIGKTVGGSDDWASILKNKDSFRDGKANQRIGFYLKVLLDGYDAVLSKQEAIRQANKRYIAAFGRDKVEGLS